MGFSTPSFSLMELFDRIDRGDLQLPDFQRTYSWDVDRIRSLIVTVLRGYPIGVFMALDTRDAPVSFRARPVSGAPNTKTPPGMLLLDGQQRLTTLYHCLRGDGFVDTVNPQGRSIRRRFFVDASRAICNDVLPDDAVFAVDEHDRVRSHFGPETLEGGQLVPVADLLGASDLLFDLAGRSVDRGLVRSFFDEVVYPLGTYQVPMIRLSRRTAHSGVGSIFAQANSAGLQMDVFDLLTAVFGAQDPDFSLPREFAAVAAKLKRYPALDAIGRTEFLIAVSLLVTARKGAPSGTREDILKLTLEEYRSAARDVTITFQEAAEFLMQRCIFSRDQVPYTEQVISLAVILALLSDTPRALAQVEAWDRLNRWFWCGVFGELYASDAVIHRMAYDVGHVPAWVCDRTAELPRTVSDASFDPASLDTRDKDSGIYRGIFALLMAKNARDWRTVSPFDRWTWSELKPEFTRIYPARWCQSQKISAAAADCVLNRTPMGRRTEVIRDGSAPGRYLARVQAKSLMSDREFDAVLEGHCVDPELVRGDFETFIEDRRERLANLIFEVTGLYAEAK